MPEPHIVPDESSPATDEQVRAALHRAAADAELRASPLPPHEITKRGRRRLRLRHLTSSAAGGAAAVAIVASFAVLTNNHEPQTVLPGSPAPSQLITPSVSPESSAPPESSVPPTSTIASTTTPTESR